MELHPCNHVVMAAVSFARILADNCLRMICIVLVALSSIVFQSFCS
jgi:hypothetical protein